MTAIEDWHSAMGRIVSETNAPGAPDVDRRQLYDGLCDAVANYRTFEAFGKAGEARHRRIIDKATRASRLISSLADLLKDQEFSDALPNLSDIERGNAVAAEAVAAILAKPGFAKINSELNAATYLVGRQLPPVYEKTFDREAGRSRPADGGQIGGPYIRFTTAVLREFGLGSYSPEYIGQMYATGAKARA